MAGDIVGRGYGSPDFVKELRPSTYSVSTDKDSHFTDQLIQDASESENVSGLRSSRVRILKAVMQSDQQLKFGLFIYRTKDFDDLDIDSDKFVGYLEFNSPRYGVQQSGGQYRIDLNGLDIDYIDEDVTNQLHLVLKNLSPTTKNSGPTGEVKFDFSIETKSQRS